MLFPSLNFLPLSLKCLHVQSRYVKVRHEIKLLLLNNRRILNDYHKAHVDESRL